MGLSPEYRRWSERTLLAARLLCCPGLAHEQSWNGKKIVCGDFNNTAYSWVYNQISKNKKDALVINVAGKERMLTQKISKNIFYLYHNNTHSFSELDNATVEFIYNLDSLREGNELIGILKAPTDDIRKQISKVEILWNNFYSNINQFKEILLNKNESNEKELKNIVELKN